MEHNQEDLMVSSTNVTNQNKSNYKQMYQLQKQTAH